MIDVRPRRLTRVCWATAVVVLVAFGVLATLLDRGDAGGRAVRVGDQVAFFLFGVLLAAGLVAFTRFRVRADESGVWVRNVLGERFFPWAVVVSVDLPPGASWAQLELHDDETVALLALQSNDGEPTIDNVLALRALMQTGST